MPANAIDQAADKAKGAAEDAADTAASSPAAERRFSEAARRFERAVQDSIETIRAQSRTYADTAGEQMDEAQRYVVERVRERPLVSTAAALGIGLLIGLALSGGRPLIFKTALRAFSAAALLATALAIALIAGAVALGALLCEYIGLPGAAASVALLAAVVAAIAGLLLKPRSGPRKLAGAPNQDDILGRAMDLARKRPVLAATATLAVGVFALRNPKLIGALVSALIAKEAVTPSKR